MEAVEVLEAMEVLGGVGGREVLRDCHARAGCQQRQHHRHRKKMVWDDNSVAFSPPKKIVSLNLLLHERLFKPHIVLRWGKAERMMAELTEIQKKVMGEAAHQAGMDLAQTMGGYGALGGLAIGGMYAQKSDKPILAGAGLVGGLIAGLLGGYFTGSMKAKKQFTKDPALIPVKEELPPSPPKLIPVGSEEELWPGQWLGVSKPGTPSQSDPASPWL